MSSSAPVKGTKAVPRSSAGVAKRAVVLWQEDLLEEAVGLDHVGDAGEPEFLGQALLQGAEHALRAPPCLGRVGRDQLDAELRQGAADPGSGCPCPPLPPASGRVPVVAGAVGVERAEQALGPDRLGHPLEARHGALFGDEEGRVDIAGRIVHGDDQVPPSTGDPLVARAVLVQHHAGQGTARPLAPVRPTPGRRAPAPMGLQAQPQPAVAALEAVIGHQLLVEVLGREVPVAGVEQLQHPRHLVHRRAPRREAAQAAVVETVGSLRLVAVAPAPEGALRRHPEPPPPPPGSSHPDGCARKPPRTSSISVPVPAPSDASPPSMAWRRSKTGQIIWYINRTYRVLPTRVRLYSCLVVDGAL